MKKFLTRTLLLASLSLAWTGFTTRPAMAYTSATAPDGDMSVTLTTITNPSAEGDTYQVKALVKNEGPAIAAESGASIRLRLGSFQLDGINLAGSAPSGWSCTPSYNAQFKESELVCTYSGSIAAAEQIEFMVTGKVQDCGFVQSPMGGGGTIESFEFMRGYISGSANFTGYVYKDTNTANDNYYIKSNQSDWCNATNEKITSVNDANNKMSGSTTDSTATQTTKVPSTGFSGLTTSLMVILSGLSLAGASIFAVSKFRR